MCMVPGAQSIKSTIANKSVIEFKKLRIREIPPKKNHLFGNIRMDALVVVIDGAEEPLCYINPLTGRIHFIGLVYATGEHSEEKSFPGDDAASDEVINFVNARYDLLTSVIT